MENEAWQVIFAAKKAGIVGHVEHRGKFQIPGVLLGSLIHHDRHALVYLASQATVRACPEHRTGLGIWIEPEEIVWHQLKNALVIFQVMQTSQTEAKPPRG